MGKDYNEFEWEEGFASIVMVFTIFLIFTAPVWFTWIEADVKGNDMCKYYGYDRMTDHNHEAKKIECDNEKIMAYEDKEYCTKVDKWGDCSYEHKWRTIE